MTLDDDSAAVHVCTPLDKRNKRGKPVYIRARTAAGAREKAYEVLRLFKDPRPTHIIVRLATVKELTQ